MPSSFAHSLGLSRNLSKISQDTGPCPSSLDIVATAPSSPTHTSHRSVLSVSQLSDSSVSSVDSSVTSTSTASNSTQATSVSSSRRSSVSHTYLAPTPDVGNKETHAQANCVPPRPLSVRKEASTGPVTPRRTQASKLGIGTPLTASRSKLHPLDNNVSSPDATKAEDTSLTATCTERFQTPRHLIHRSQTTSLGQSPHDDAFSTSNPAGFLKGHRRAQSSIEVGSLSPNMRSPMTPHTRWNDLGKSGLPPAHRGVRTMEEKKAYLETMISNVDALVEGIQKQGIFGLG